MLVLRPTIRLWSLFKVKTYHGRMNHDTHRTYGKKFSALAEIEPEYVLLEHVPSTLTVPPRSLALMAGILLHLSHFKLELHPPLDATQNQHKLMMQPLLVRTYHKHKV